METQFVVDIARTSIYTVLMVSAPMLALALVVGLAISILQAITQIQEMTLTFIPKIVAVAVALVIFLPWMITTIVTFASNLIQIIPTLGR
ncbi:MAG: flagellar biosynthesis protein FliQ [Candidatus Zixiibacteriota bacterium]|jgi:flagellar biosynthetic protein FliQ|nr:MAG: flagellar biosynthesis protein FliQ [candidate division Zixibacteria bacterium]